MDSAFCVAVHAMVYLNHKAHKTVSSEELAENICTNPARVRKIMACLKKAGLVDTKAGSAGGYVFSGDPGRVSLAQIAESMGARLVEASWRSGDTDMDCLVASGMADLMDQVFLDLNERCMARLQQITLEDLNERLFSEERKKAMAAKAKPAPPPRLTPKTGQKE